MLCICIGEMEIHKDDKNDKNYKRITKIYRIIKENRCYYNMSYSDKK